MDPNNPNPLNFGSGSATLGGNAGPELQRLIAQQRLGQAPVTAQVTPAGMPGGAPTSPSPDASQPTMQTAAPTMGTPGMAPASPSGGLTPEAENQIILEALTHKLKSNSKISEAKHIPPQPLTGG